MVEIEAYEVRIIKYISVKKQSAAITNIFSYTIVGVICESEQRFSDLNGDIKKFKSQTIPWQYWTVTGMQVEQDPLTTILWWLVRSHSSFNSFPFVQWYTVFICRTTRSLHHHMLLKGHTLVWFSCVLQLSANKLFQGWGAIAFKKQLKGAKL